MARGKLGSWEGTVTAGEDMVPILAKGKSSAPFGIGFGIRKIAISGVPGLRFTLNDAVITLTDTGIFETSEDAIDVNKLVFHTSDNVNIVFLY